MKKGNRLQDGLFSLRSKLLEDFKLIWTPRFCESKLAFSNHPGRLCTIDCVSRRIHTFETSHRRKGLLQAEMITLDNFI